jgi:hypothetical protein
MLLRSEFAAVRVAVDNHGNGQRLAITDLKSGHRVFFDPLELEALVWTTHDELTDFLDPKRRWSDDAN